MPMLDLWPGQLVKTTHFDDEMRQLADRHYSRRTPGARQFAYSGRKLVLRDTGGLVLWVWMFPDPSMRMDGQTGYNCSHFRNESPRRSSEIIREAEQHAIAYWGPDRMYTYVDPRKIRSTNPGYCYLMAGWHKHGLSKGGKVLLVKYDECDTPKLPGGLYSGMSAAPSEGVQGGARLPMLLPGFDICRKRPRPGALAGGASCVRGGRRSKTGARTSLALIIRCIPLGVEEDGSQRQRGAEHARTPRTGDPQGPGQRT